MDRPEKNNEETQFNIANINPEPIGIFTLPVDKHLKYKKEIHSIWKSSPEELRQDYKKEKHFKHICNTSNQNLFNSFPQLFNLKSEIKKILLTYIKNIGFSAEDIIINSAWLNMAEKDAQLVYHHHSNSYISANYFVDFDPEKHSFLSFRNDRLPGSGSPDFQSMQIPEIKNKKTLYNTPYLSMPAKEGQIFVWRSHKSHGYHIPNKADGRLTLSLNSIPKVLDNGSYCFSVCE